MKAKSCEDAKQQKVHGPHEFSTEHGHRRCRGYSPGQHRGARPVREDAPETIWQGPLDRH